MSYVFIPFPTNLKTVGYKDYWKNPEYMFNYMNGNFGRIFTQQ